MKLVWGHAKSPTEKETTIILIKKKHYLIATKLSTGFY